MFLTAFAPYAFRKLTKHETRRGVAWAGTLHAGGKDVANVADDGDGRALQVTFGSPQAEVDFDDFVANLPEPAKAQVLLGTDQAVGVSRDHVLSAIADLAETAARFKARCKRNTLFITSSNSPGEISVLKVPFSPKVKAALEREHGAALQTILNEVV